MSPVDLARRMRSIASFASLLARLMSTKLEAPHMGQVFLSGLLSVIGKDVVILNSAPERDELSCGRPHYRRAEICKAVQALSSASLAL